MNRAAIKRNKKIMPPNTSKSRTAAAKTENLKKKAALFFSLALLFIGLMLFLPAGSLSYWQGWLFMGTLFIPVFFVAPYLLKHNPKLLERRLNFREKEAEQKTLMKVAGLLFFAGILVPGFDYRYGWSRVSPALSIASDFIILLCYFMIFVVFRENPYASRTVQVVKGQRVITTGPYAVVRHPMYVASIVMYLFIPLALGSYWALLFIIPAVSMVIPRMLNEEKVLLRDLRGYREYMKKVRYRLIPGVW